jgi:hypothetical protein
VQNRLWKKKTVLGEILRAQQEAAQQTIQKIQILHWREKQSMGDVYANGGAPLTRSTYLRNKKPPVIYNIIT